VDDEQLKKRKRNARARRGMNPCATWYEPWKKEKEMNRIEKRGNPLMSAPSKQCFVFFLLLNERD